MSKQLLSLSGSLGSLVATEDSGNVSLVASEDAVAGGGNMAGFLEVKGSASITLKGTQLLMVAQALLNAHLSGVALTIAQGVEAVADGAIAAAE